MPNDDRSRKYDTDHASEMRHRATFLTDRLKLVEDWLTRGARFRVVMDVVDDGVNYKFVLDRHSKGWRVFSARDRGEWALVIDASIAEKVAFARNIDHFKSLCDDRARSLMEATKDAAQCVDRFIASNKIDEYLAEGSAVE